MSKVTAPRPSGSNFGGKWSFQWAYDNFPLPVGIAADHDETVCRLHVDYQGMFGDGTPLIVYGDLENGTFYLASPEGLSLDFVGADSDISDYLCNAPTYAAFKGAAWQKIGVTFYYYACKDAGRLTCPAKKNSNYNDYGFLNIDTSGQAHDVFGPTCHVQGLSWIKSNGGAKCDLSYVDLSNVDLSGVDLSGANLAHANLSGAILTKATFTGATLTNADFTGATLKGTKFINCDLRPATFSPGAVFGTSDAPASFAGSTLPYDMIGLNWSYLDLTGATIENLPVDLTGLQAIGATVNAFPSKVQLVNASFQNADLTGAVFTNANLTGAILTGANLTKVNFDVDTQLKDALFEYAFLKSTTIDATNLSGANFSFATLIESAFNANAVTLDLTSFATAYLDTVHFPATLSLRGSNFSGACLINCKLTGADLSKSGTTSTDLNGAFIQGADFSNAKLGGADLTDAVVSFDQGSITTQHCDGDGSPSIPFPMRFSKTTGLDQSTLQDDTICPNGNRYDENNKNKLSLSVMLTAYTTPPTQWVPRSCR